MDDFESKDQFEEFCKVFDESDQELYEDVRFKLGTDFQKGWGHNSIYNVTDFKNGTLEALEQTRQKLSCKSAEEIIDILYTLEYSNKRIIYIIWKLGYLNISFRDLRKYLEQNKRRLKESREKYMAELGKKKIQLFQDAQDKVLSAEEKTLNIYLEAIKECQEELENHPKLVIEEPTKFKRLSRTINELQEKIDAMHGVTKKRDASIRINEQLTLLQETKKLESSPVDTPAIENGELEHNERLL